MSVLPFNRAQLSQAIAQMFGLKGGYTPLVESDIRASVTIADLSDSPYLKYGIPVAAWRAVAATAAEFSYSWCRPGPNVALQIKAITVSNVNAGAQDVELMMLTAANVTTVGEGGRTQMAELAGGNAGRSRSSWVSSGVHTAQVGTGFDNKVIPASQSIVFEIPDPGIILYGDDPDGTPALAVCGRTVNEAVRAAFYGREWPLPG